MVEAKAHGSMLSYSSSFSLLSFVFILLSSLRNSQQQSQNETALEIRALVSFHLGLLDPLGALANWNASSPEAPCDWRGVVCDSGRVCELRLPRLRLQGPLSPHIGLLTSLRKLSLQSNLHGTILASLSRCSLLRAVFLQSNALSDRIPPEIFNLTGLQVLNLADNLLIGGVPSVKLPMNLQYLDLSSNQLSSEIPGNVSSSGLQLLNLSFNRLPGGIPASFGESSALEYLWLDGNLIQESIPAALANCSFLRHISLRDNGLRGEVPAGISDTVSVSHRVDADTPTS